LPRGSHPAGGISSTAGDQIKWARFHLGDGRAEDGSRVVADELLKSMQRPTVDMRGSALGDYVGLSWLLRDVDGVRLVSHGGSTNGQYSAFVMVPERDFAVAVLTNCGPNGSELHDELVKWALEAYLGVIDKDPDPVELSEADLVPYAGHYETIAAECDVTVEGTGLLVKVTIKPEVLAQIRESGEEVPDEPPIPLGLLAGEGDRYIVSGGPAKGMKGYFVRSPSGEVEAVHMGGRLATRRPVAAGAGSR
jgi:hypothetical protein